MAIPGRSVHAMSPIHNLPVELLSRVFMLGMPGGVYPEFPPNDQVPFEILVSHVCRHWRSVLLYTSGFWSDAVKGGRFTPDDHSTGYLWVMLERSAPRMVAPSFCRFSALGGRLASSASKAGRLSLRNCRNAVTGFFGRFGSLIFFSFFALLAGFISLLS